MAYSSSNSVYVAPLSVVGVGVNVIGGFQKGADYRTCVFVTVRFVADGFESVYDLLREKGVLNVPIQNYFEVFTCRVPYSYWISMGKSWWWIRGASTASLIFWPNQIVRINTWNKSFLKDFANRGKEKFYCLLLLLSSYILIVAFHRYN
jgi:hypothetical protein